MENELNYLSEKIETLEQEIDQFTYNNECLHLIEEKQLLENILNAITINELK